MKNDVAACFKVINKKTLLVIFVAYLVKKTLQAEDPFYYVIPNALMFLPYPGPANFFWRMMDPQDRLKTKKFEHQRILELSREEFSFETMKKATDGFRHPILVRDFFAGTPAMEKWGKKEYMNKKFGHYIVPVIGDRSYNASKTIDPHEVGEKTYFRDKFHDILENNSSKSYLFFPMTGLLASDLAKTVNDVIISDLEYDKRIWPGFGRKGHVAFAGTQIIIGRGSNSTEETTGTQWHSEPSNNWFSLVYGAKRWYMMDPKFSSYMHPVRAENGKVVRTGSMRTGDLMDKLPLLYADVRAGDMLYTPNWFWHTVQNYEGFTVSCPVREFNFSLVARNNAQYTAQMAMNVLFSKAFIEALKEKIFK